MRLASPWALLALVLLVPVLYRWLRRPGQQAVGFSSLEGVLQAGRSWRQRLLWLPPALHLVALICLVAALARPQAGVQRVQDVHEGVAIEMVLDISSSMDLSLWASRSGSRLETAKRVFEQFVVGDGQRLRGRPHDLIGMVTFARYADTVCPLTLGHDALIRFLHEVKIEDRPGEDGTAIGDALALAAARLKKAEETLRQQAEQPDSQYTIKSKVIILLTDGENNSGKHLPEQAAALARKWGIRVYAIGFGEPPRLQAVEAGGGVPRAPVQLGADTKTLVRIAESTGGMFRMAHDADTLRGVYEEIDQLEKSRICTRSSLEYRERFAPLAAAAAAALALELLLRSTWLRKVP